MVQLHGYQGQASKRRKRDIGRVGEQKTITIVLLNPRGLSTNTCWDLVSVSGESLAKENESRGQSGWRGRGQRESGGKRIRECGISHSIIHNNQPCITHAGMNPAIPVSGGHSSAPSTARAIAQAMRTSVRQRRSPCSTEGYSCPYSLWAFAPRLR